MKKLLPFDLENNPMTDDPLQFLLNFTGIVLINKHTHWIRCLLLTTLIFLESFNGVAIFRYFFGQMESIKKYISLILVPQTIYAGLTFFIVCLKNIGQMQQTLFELFSDLGNAADERFLRKLKSAKKIIIFVCVFICISNVIIFSFFLPFVGDEQDICYPIKFSNECGQFSNLLKVSLYVFHIFSIIGLSYPIIIFIYLTFHFKFQCELLYNYFEINIAQFTLAGKNCIEDAGYQREIYRRLKVCAKHHELLNRSIKRFKPMFSVLILCYCVNGDISSIGCVYFIAADISPRSNFRMYSAVMCAIFTTVLDCALGQIISDQSDVFYNILCSSPWYDWNVRNRKLLLIMLHDAYLEPFKISCYGIITINFPFLLQFLKVTYSFLAVAINFT